MLADGTYTIKANVSDAAGNAAATATQAITVDETSPTIAITTPIAGDNIINKTEATAGVTISGSASSGTGGAAVNGQTATITIVDSTNTVKDTLITNVSGGAWSVNLTAAQAQLLADGTYTIKANVSDAAGNAATTASQAITVDETSPTIAITSPIAGDNIINKTEAGAGVTISGTVSSGSTSVVNGQTATITIVDSTNTVKDTLTSNVSGGAWSVNLSAAQAQLLADGTYTVKANVSDAAGNAATTATQAIAVDTVAPTVAIGTQGTTTNQATQTISGTVTTTEAAAGGTVALFDTVNGVTTQIGTATVSGGNWSTTVTLSGNGANSIVAQDTDAAGNTGSSPPVVFTLATVAPTIAITTPIAGDNVINKTEATAGVTISGTAAAGIGGAAVNGQTATITIVDSTNAVKDTLSTTVSGGAWSVSLSAAQAQGLADGNYTIKANVSDAAGNAATTATQAITVDETNPTIAITSPVAGDNTINKTEAAAGVTISGTAAAGTGGALVNGQTATITIVDGSNVVKDTLTATVTAGAWSVSLTPSQAQSLTDGSYTIKANVSDAAGNAANTATQAITVDETNPTIVITSPIAGDNVINKAEAGAGVTISGTASSSTASTVNGQTATITIVDSTNTVKDTLTTTVSGGAWSVSLNATQAQGLADGSYTIKANVSDAAGNAATTATQAITVAETAPSIAITSPIAGDNVINKTEATAGVTISGTVSAGTASIVNGQTATITLVNSSNVVVDTFTPTVTAGAWSINLSTAQAQGLADGTYTIKANVSDAAGNAATTATQAITVDETSPTIAITTPVAGDNIINKTEAIAGVTISGTVSAGTTSVVNGQTATITLVNSSNVVVDTFTPTVTAGAWSINLNTAQAQGLADGTYTIKANVSDAAGNAATTATQAITVDETSPTIAITTPIAGDNIINKTEAGAGVTISGTAAAGAGGALVNGQTATITIVDSTNTVKDTLTTTVSGGAWSVNLSTAQAQSLADGSYTIKANVSDTAGNAATTATQAITVDETSPTIAITGPVAGDNIINKTEAGAGVTISGTVSAGSTSVVNGQTATITLVNSSNVVVDTFTPTVTAGAWSVSLSAAQAHLLADGTYTVKANVSDAAGNAATTATQAITIETAQPNVTISGSSGSTSQSTQTISGTVTTTEATAGGTVLLFDTYNGVQTQIGTATLSGGAWSTTVTLSGNGTHSIVAEDTDAAGNTGTSTAVIYSLTVAANSWANPSGGSWSVGANWSSGSVPANTANDTIGIIGATAPYSVTISSGTNVLANSLTLDDPFATLDDQGTLAIAASLTLTSGTIDIEGTLSVAGSLGLGAGTIDIQNGGTLSIGSAANAFGVNFAGTGGNLVLGNAGVYTGTITALSTATGTVSITGSGNLNSSSGDALDLTASGGTTANPSNLLVGLTGTITGAVTGIDVLQNAVGNVTVTTSGSVTGQTQRGILAEESATGVGSVLVAGSANVTGEGSAFSGIVAENLNTANANTVTVSQTGNVTGGFDGIKALTDGTGNVSVTTGTGATITGTNDYGIEAFSNSTGNVSVTTATNDTIVSGSVGINVYNQATSIPQTGGSTTSTITVTAAGTIDSGFVLTGGSARPAGILAGYKGGTTSTPNSAVFGNVIVNNSANINSGGGDGIRAYNYGNGNVTISDLAGTTINAVDEFGIQAASFGTGNVTVSSVAGDIIDSGSSGLSGVNLATSIAAGISTVAVTARGTINSGFHLTPSGSQPQGVSSGYFPGNAGNSNTNVNGTVTLDNFANVTAAAGWALDAYNYGNGNVTLTDEANTTVSGAQFGIGAYSNSTGTGSSGSVTVNVGNNATISSGSLYGFAGIQANENNAGNISITTTTGDIVNSGGIGISANNQTSKTTSASQISITTAGTINSGYGINLGGGQPGGIWAGYNPGNLGTVNSNVLGNVIVDNSAVINAPAGAGIGLYNYSTGTVSLTLETTSAITSELAGVNAAAQGGGNLTIVNKGSITDVPGTGITASIGTNVANSVSGVVSVNNSGTITALGSSNSPVVQINNSSTQAAIITNSGTITANLLGKDTNNQAIAVYNGTVTITNTGTISGNVSLNGGTFNNNAGGIWNMSGSDYFGNAASSIVNAGIINILGLTFLNAGATFTFANSNTVNVAANGDADINAIVSGSGTFTIGDRAELEFANSVAAGQTVSFTDTDGLLILDSPAAFTSDSITGITAGDAIELNGIGIASATINGSTLTITETNAQTLSYQVSLNSATATFDVLHGNEIVFVPQSRRRRSPGHSARKISTTSAAQFYHADESATISTASTANGLNITSTDNVAGNYADRRNRPGIFDFHVRRIQRDQSLDDGRRQYRTDQLGHDQFARRHGHLRQFDQRFSRYHR